MSSSSQITSRRAKAVPAALSAFALSALSTVCVSSSLCEGGVPGVSGGSSGSGSAGMSSTCRCQIQYSREVKYSLQISASLQAGKRSVIIWTGAACHVFSSMCNALSVYACIKHYPRPPGTPCRLCKSRRWFRSGSGQQHRCRPARRSGA